ncbi:N-acetyltransferase [uncultured Aquimarina sp.]|uniref:N-acetyltransferase n=1 Tax=uncultured Aquimarina sp. TaxID=575652 RepID=UPI002604C93A|nr:N-acetyltransferase [uncultured Aquimarina sp.]
MIQYLEFSDLDDHLLKQYRSAINKAFPKVILHSQVIKDYWDKLEKYFPHTQLFIVDEYRNLIGFMNAIPIYYDLPLTELPDEGWDWLVKKGIEDFENKITPNSLGGLQIVVIKEYQGQGYSKLLISRGKHAKENLGFKNFIIPIRPILKHTYPEMKMEDYIDLKEHDKIFDPWIRTHVDSGAQVIKVCENSMNVTGDVHFWEQLLHKKITESGSYEIKGALNLVSIDIENNYGEYEEENIWIHYG